jgi:TfoX/Sxy family transcriptional regulator of competence genes
MGATPNLTGQTAFHFATAGPVTTRSYFVNVNLLSRMSLVAISQLSAS